jgi:beta-fructofuranosidase
VSRDDALPDPHRPGFHLTAPSGWLNDPNGLTHRDGVFHLFYQANPYAAVHDRIHWAHVTSTDLVRWHDEPIALVPGETGPDRDGCWSGVLVDDDGVPTIVYSGRHDDRELPCVAVGSPDLRTWTKDPANPVIPHTPPGVDVTAYRDHCVWREGGRWRQLVGSGVRGVGGTAFLYDSPDLRRWELVGPLLHGSADAPARGEALWSGTMWECVDLFRLCVDGTSASVGDPAARARPGVDVLLLSVWDDGVTHYPLYLTGTYAGDAFVPEATHRLDHGERYFYAPQSMADASGRRVLFGWLQEGRPEQACVEAGWSGVMSLPRVVTLAADGTLHQAPAPEVETLRVDRSAVPTGPLGPGLLDLASGDQLDVELDLLLEPGAVVEVLLRAKPDRPDGPDDGTGEQTVVRLARGEGDEQGTAVLALDRSRSSLDPDVDTTPLAGQVPVGADGSVHLRVLVDRSALEVFAGGRPLTSRVYPTRRNALGLGVRAARGTVQVQGGGVWTMRGTGRP